MCITGHGKTPLSLEVQEKVSKERKEPHLRTGHGYPFPYFYKYHCVPLKGWEWGKKSVNRGRSPIET